MTLLRQDRPTRGLPAITLTIFLVTLLFCIGKPGQAAVTSATAQSSTTARTYVWPDCDPSHPCVVHHIDTVGDGTAYGETLQDFKFPMVPSSPGNLLIFTVMHVGSKSITVTDNNNGSWQTAITTTNAADGEESDLLYTCGATAGTNLITIHLSQPAAHDEPLHFTYDEVSGIAPAACLDGIAAANGMKGTVQPGPVTTTVDGDMIFNYGEETYQYPEYDAPIGGITPDSSSALLTENTIDKYASEVSLQPAHGAYTPTLTVNADPSPRNWNSVAAAFIPSVGAGTQPTGIHVTRILHYVGIVEKSVSVPFPSSGNAIVISTSNPSVGGWGMANLTDNAGHTYSRTPFINGDTDPQIFFTCLGAATGGQNLVISWTPSSINNHVLFYDIAGANATGGSTGCVGATVDTVLGAQLSTPNAPMTGDPVITPTTAGSVIVTTSYVGTGPPSASLTPGVVFNSIWATGMTDASSWDTGDPYAYVYTTSINPISFNWQMANANGQPNGGTNFDGAAIEIVPPANPLTSIAVTPANSTIATGTTQQFVATGTYSDGSTQDITASAAWTSFMSSTASVTAAGTANGLCSGSTNISASQSSISGETSLIITGLGQTKTTVSSSANPAAPNQNITFTAVVASTCGTPTGSVQFIIDGASYGNAVPLNSGIAQTTATLSVGTHSIAAAYSGSDSFVPSNSSGFSQGVNTIAPTIAVSNSPVVYSGTPQPAIIASSVSGAFSNVLYSGSPVVPTAAGTYAITASFTPSDTVDYQTLTGVSAGIFIISKATPTLAISNSPVIYTGKAQAVVLSSSTPGSFSTIKYSGSSTVPTKAGTYAITAGFTPADTGDYFSVTNFSVGSFVISRAAPTLRVTTASPTYNGAAHAVSVSGSVGGTVTNILYNGSPTAPVAAGTYAITANFTPSDTTDYLTLTGAFAGSFVINKATPTLKVTNSGLTYNGSPLPAVITGSVPGTVSGVLYSGSSAVPVAAGTYAVVASFTPNDATDYNSLNAVSAGTFVINKATPSVTLSSSLNPSKAGVLVTFTAALPPTATGSVTFSNGGSTLGTGTVLGGVATYSTSTLSKGRHSITASYGGDSNYKTAKSGTLTQTVN